MKKNVWFVSGIDTNVGKTYATGLLARAFAEKKVNVITQKMIQTGCKDSSEDIDMHRRLQNLSPLDEDAAHLTCPYIFSYPCSPHLAAELDHQTIDPAKITSATRQLLEHHDLILLEGAGGLMVPLTHDLLTIDYVRAQNYPLLLVTSGKLGSLNHTLLSLYACQREGIEVKALVYNHFPHIDDVIEQDSLSYLYRHFPRTPIIELAEQQEEGNECILPDISPLLNVLDA